MQETVISYGLFYEVKVETSCFFESIALIVTSDTYVLGAERDFMLGLSVVNVANSIRAARSVVLQIFSPSVPIMLGRRDGAQYLWSNNRRRNPRPTVHSRLDLLILHRDLK